MVVGVYDYFSSPKGEGLVWGGETSTLELEQSFLNLRIGSSRIIKKSTIRIAQVIYVPNYRSYKYVFGLWNTIVAAVILIYVLLKNYLEYISYTWFVKY
jgi:hypothetical protein